MFTQKCFIRKNTPELRKIVYDLGHRGISIYDDIMGILCANESDIRCWDDEWGNADGLISKGYIDCGTNEELFLAIAALRDDSDYMQWFEEDETIEYGVSGFNAPRKKIGEKWYQYSVDNNNISNKIKYNFDTYGHIDGYEQQLHKATVEELIKHFSK